MRSLLRWLRNFAVWFAKPRLAWLMLVVLLLAMVIIVRLRTDEQTIRITGMVLEIFGLGTVAWGVSQTRRRFGRPSIVALTRQWLGQIPRWPRNHVISLAGVASAGAVGSARGHAVYGVGPNPTIEERVDALEKNLKGLDERFNQARNEIEAKVRKQSESIDEERRTRASADENLRKTIEDTETGGLHLSAVGLVWLLVGLILSTIPEELAALLQ